MMFFLKKFHSKIYINIFLFLILLKLSKNIKNIDLRGFLYYIEGLGFHPRFEHGESNCLAPKI
jgi:hypothetical protein